MALTFDATTEVAPATTDPLTFNHTAAANTKALCVFIGHGTIATDIVSQVRWGGSGGTIMTRVQSNSDTATEPGRVYGYFLGAGITSGVQQVWIDRTEATTTVWACAATWTGAADTEVVDQDGLDNDRANPSVTLQFASRECVAVSVDYTGTASPATVGTGCTLLHTHDFTAFGVGAERITTPQTADFAIAQTHASDDCAYSAFAFAELAVPITPIVVTAPISWPRYP